MVTLVQELYWELVFRIQELEVRRLSLKLAQDLLAQTRVQVAVGTQPQLSILEGEAGVAAREEARHCGRKQRPKCPGSAEGIAQLV